MGGKAGCPPRLSPVQKWGGAGQL
ncbi:hypothetical protein A2U01_0092307, partial [Trifolium medium]|nr:hypothetical protein [Trifolium medium]